MKKNTRFHFFDTLKSVFRLIIWTVVFLFLFQRCRYGFANVDESFYLTIPLRVLQGDSLLVDEWHVTQFSSVFLLPFVKFFLHGTKNIDGIILYARHVFVIVWMIGCLITSIYLKRYSKTASFIAMLGVALFAPYGINALSYNSIPVFCLILAVVLLDAGEQYNSMIYPFIGGIFYSLAVLCCPYLSILFIVVILWILIEIKYRAISSFLYSKRILYYFILGVLFSALVFITTLFFKTSVKDVFSSIPQLFKDPEHGKVSFADRYYGTVLPLKNMGKYSRYTYILLLLCFGISAVFMVINKKAMKVIYIFVLVLTLALLIDYYKANININFLMIPINILGFYNFLFTSSLRKTKIPKIMICFFFVGLIYSICQMLSSNQKHYAFSYPLVISSIPSIFLSLQSLENENKSFGKKMIVVISTVFIIVQIYAEFEMRYEKNYWDSNTPKQVFYVDKGIYKGIFVTEEKKELCEWIERVHRQIRNYTPNSVLFLSEKTYLYLQNEYKNASYSAWLSGVRENSFSRLCQYYEISSHEKPDVIFLENENSDKQDRVCDLFGYHVDQINGDGIFMIPNES